MDLLHENTTDFAPSTNRSQLALPHERLSKGSICLPLKPPKSSAVRKTSEPPEQRSSGKGAASSHPKTLGPELVQPSTMTNLIRNTIASSRLEAQNLINRREEKLPRNLKQPTQEPSRVSFTCIRSRFTYFVTGNMSLTGTIAQPSFSTASADEEEAGCKPIHHP